MHFCAFVLKGLSLEKFYDILPEPAKRAAARFLVDELQTMPSLAFVLSSMTPNELSLELINEANDFIVKNEGYELMLFSLERGVPVVPPRFAVYNSAELNTYMGTVVATDIPSWQAALVAPAKKRYLYIYDINLAMGASPELVAKVNESEFIVFGRTEAHNRALQEKGFKVARKSLKYFDGKAILEFLND